MPSTELYVFKYTRKPEYYSDLYDKGTIAECKYYLDAFTIDPKKLSEPLKEENGEEMTPEKRQALYKSFADLSLYFTRGERYMAKDKTIKEWMDRDRKLDERLARVTIKTRYCDRCGQTMDCIDKSYQGANNERIIVMYMCPDCKRARAFYDNGEEYDPESKCKKCYSTNTSKSIRNGRTITITDTCDNCGNVEVDDITLSEEKQPDKAQEEKERRQFIADREKYCIDDQKGGEYISFKEGLKTMEEIANKHKEKENNKALYDEVAKVQKLNVAQLKQLLSPALEKEKYTALEFSNPEMKRGVIVSFTVQENDTDRKEYDSKHGLRKLIDATLLNTNWRLMSDGIYTRLGVLSGRLKGVESEEEIANLIKKDRLKNL